MRAIGYRRHASSTGKVLLAFLPADVWAARLADWTPARLTRYTIVNREALLADLRRVAQRGWARNVEEGTLVAAPIRDGSGEVVAALSVVLPVGRADAQAVRRCAAAAVEAGAVISGRLGLPEAPS